MDASIKVSAKIFNQALVNIKRYGLFSASKTSTFKKIKKQLKKGWHWEDNEIDKLFIEIKNIQKKEKI